MFEPSISIFVSICFGETEIIQLAKRSFLNIESSVSKGRLEVTTKCLPYRVTCASSGRSSEKLFLPTESGEGVKGMTSLVVHTTSATPL